MIAVKRGACPASLAGDQSVGGIETAAAVAYYSRTPPVGKKPDFKAYKKDDVRSALVSMFGPKCAYCETEYAAGNSPDTEHYRPKSEIEGANRVKIERGYYWLAATWSNLLPTCVYCNRRRKHLYEDGPRFTGKGIKFPLADESKRATEPGKETDEEPLLLDPTVDEPSQHLSFGEEAVVSPAPTATGACPRGEETIEILGLNRPGLIHSRQAQLRWVDDAIQRYHEAVENLEQNPGDHYAERQRDRAYSELEKRSEGSAPYAEMTRQRIAELLG
jgi:uncharacterized protein (TIGR02646 family)